MTTVKQIDRLWNGRDHRRLIDEIASGRPELNLLAQRLLGPVAAAAVAVIRLDELGQGHQPVVGRLIRAILAAQESGGGWGSVAVTVLALRALRCCQGRGAAIDRGIRHLAEIQKPEGAWPDEPVRRLPADALATAFVLINLGQDADLAGNANLPAAAAWLEAHRDEMDAATWRLAQRAIGRVGRQPAGLWS